MIYCTVSPTQNTVSTEVKKDLATGQRWWRARHVQYMYPTRSNHPCRSYPRDRVYSAMAIRRGNPVPVPRSRSDAICLGPWWILDAPKLFLDAQRLPHGVRLRVGSSEGFRDHDWPPPSLSQRSASDGRGAPLGMEERHAMGPVPVSARDILASHQGGLSTRPPTEHVLCMYRTGRAPQLCRFPGRLHVANAVLVQDQP